MRYEKTYLNCVETVKPVRDTLDILSVKWELPIIILVSIENNRFTDIQVIIFGVRQKLL